MKTATPAQMRLLRDIAAYGHVRRMQRVQQHRGFNRYILVWRLSDGHEVAERVAIACEQAGWVTTDGALRNGDLRLVLTDQGRIALKPNAAGRTP